MITLKVNGEEHEVAISPDATLLQVLRNELGLLGTKRGCDTSACGCCTVHMDGKAVYSCVVYAMSIQGNLLIRSPVWLFQRENVPV